jgi:hypothetical protein
MRDQHIRYINDLLISFNSIGSNVDYDTVMRMDRPTTEAWHDYLMKELNRRKSQSGMKDLEKQLRKM